VAAVGQCIVEARRDSQRRLGCSALAEELGYLVGAGLGIAAAGVDFHWAHCLQAPGTFPLGPERKVGLGVVVVGEESSLALSLQVVGVDEPPRV